MPKGHTIYLGLGSNIGRRTDNIAEAIRNIARIPSCHIVKTSSLYETSPVGPHQRNFINLAVKITAALTPEQLHCHLREIEKDMGRPRKRKRWFPRVIDIDILFFNRRILCSPELIIPHPEVQNRLFVLQPLAEIAPGLIHPAIKMKIERLRDKLLLTHPAQKVTIYKYGK